MNAIVTLLTDFGLKDAYVAQVKARIISEHPVVRIVDISHDIPSFSVISGAWLMYTTYSWFPEGSVHLAVVDPGVGTGRTIIGMRKGGHVFIGPDNGIFSFIFPAEEVIEIKWRPKGHIASTFHGRDVFAPIVSRILSGASLESLGSVVDRPFKLDVLKPMVVHVDRFGNVITNIDEKKLMPGCRLEVAGRLISFIADTFSDVSGDDLALLKGSAGTIEIVSDQKSAAKIIGASSGMPVNLILA